MKLTLLSTVIAVILLSCGSLKENSSNGELNYTIESLNIEENGFEGNIVVEVYDNQGKPISDYQFILRNNSEIIFDVQQQNHQCTFFKDGKNLTIEIKKKGYKPFISQSFNTEEEMDNAQFLKITLDKE